ncbi:hypothetical protein OL548_06630 [Lysinibacillus sp. MHQ-1]|nr:hypothetical protein OL548_06630 [Lysinibacillus sp. MHQ-1]
MKAIDLQVAHLFIKPIDLEVLKQKLTVISVRSPQIIDDAQETANESFYNHLFLDTKSNSIETGIHFTIIEPEHAETYNKLYNWLQQTPIYFHMKTYPLSNRIVCLFQTQDIKVVEKDVRTLMKEWRLFSNSSLNIGIYDGPATSIKKYVYFNKACTSPKFLRRIRSPFFTQVNNLKYTPSIHY